MAFITKRLFSLCLFFLMLVSLLITRLIYLQAMEGSKLAAEGLSSRVNEVPIAVARGEILDCNGLYFTNTTKHFSILLFPEQMEDVQKTVSDLSDVTGLSIPKILIEIGRADQPLKLQLDIDAITAQKINSLQHPGVVAVAEKKRYGYSLLASHAVGYINTVDNRGISGIEGQYDEILRGNKPEYIAAMVDAGQHIIPGLGYKRLKIGSGTEPCNVVLTLDSRIQKSVESVIEGKISKGAVLVLRPSTGEILAMVSRPNFDANNVSEYLNQNSAPLLNRTVSSYQPGSVFKLAVAAAALESNIVSPDDVFSDPGYIDVNKLRFKGWDYESGGRGQLTFTEAMAYSSNPVFIQVGLKLGAEKLLFYAREFGFGYHTELNFDGEANGNLPSAKNMYPGDLANLAIGQGSFEATPLQIAVLVSTIVNDGIKVQPCLVHKLTTEDGTNIRTFPLSQGTRVISQSTALKMREMMVAVTRYGTGHEAYVKGYGSAGKTGTAETGRIDVSGKGIDHAWFAGYTPIINPQYVIVVFVEEGMSGGDIAAPLFREIAAQLLAL